MKQKILLNFGGLIAITTPIITVIACSNKSEAEKQIDQINHQYFSTFTVQGIKDYLKLIAEDGEVDLTKLGIDMNQMPKLDQGWSVKYYLVGKANDYTHGDLKIKVKVINDLDQTTTAEKEISLTPLAKDSTKPIINLPTEIINQDQSIPLAWSNQKSIITIKPNNNLTKANVESAFSAHDNSGENMIVDFTWTENGKPWTGDNFNEEATYKVAISTVDHSNNQSLIYNLDLQVSPLKVEIDKVNQNPEPTKSAEKLHNFFQTNNLKPGDEITDFDALGLDIEKVEGYNYKIEVKESYDLTKNEAVVNLIIEKKDPAIGPASSIKSLTTEIVIQGLTQKMWDPEAKIGNIPIDFDPNKPNEASVSIDLDEPSIPANKAAMETQIKTALDNIGSEQVNFSWDQEYTKAKGTYIATITINEKTFKFSVTITSSVKWNPDAIIGDVKISIDDSDPSKASVSLPMNKVPAFGPLSIGDQIKKALKNSTGLAPGLRWNADSPYAGVYVNNVKGTFQAIITVGQETLTMDIIIT